MKDRLKRVNELLKREIGSLFQKDFTFDGALVTVNEVTITPDLKQAQVYLGVLGSAAHKREVLEKLQARRPLIQERLSKRVVLKHTPQLQFKVDDSVERGVRVLSLIDELEIPDEPTEEKN